MFELSLTGKRLALSSRSKLSQSTDLPPYKVERHSRIPKSDPSEKARTDSPAAHAIGTGSNGHGCTPYLDHGIQQNSNVTVQAASASTARQVNSTTTHPTPIINPGITEPEIVHTDIPSTSTDQSVINYHIVPSDETNIHHEITVASNSSFSDGKLLEKLHKLNLQQQLNTDLLLSQTWSVEPASLDWLRDSITKKPEDQFFEDEEGLCFRYVREDPPTKMLHLKQEALKMEELRLLREAKLVKARPESVKKRRKQWDMMDKIKDNDYLMETAPRLERRMIEID